MLRKAFVATATLALLMSVSFAQAAPQDGLDSANELRPGSSSDAVEDSQAAWYAAFHDVPLQTAEAMQSDMELLMDQLTNLAERLGDDSFDLWVEHSEDRQLIYVRTINPDIALAMHEIPLSPSTEVVILNEAPVAQSVDNDDELAELVIEHVEGAQGLFIDAETGALVIDVHRESAGAARSAVTDLPNLGKFGVDEVKIEVQGEPTEDSITVRGGVGLGSCTAGFPARQGSYIGYYSAAHCGPSQTTYANTAGTGASTTGTRRHYVHNGNGDIGFYSVSASNNTVVGSFFGSSSSSATTVGPPISIAQGATICSRGKSSGWRCGTVRSNAYRPTYSGACPTGTCNARFVSVNANQALGDSGGPWVYGSRPVGIHKGGSSTMSITSKIEYAPSASSLW